MVPPTTNSADEEIITVFQIFRHGSKNPLRIFKNELYEDMERIPEELGKLTKKGKLEAYQLGQYTKNRYDNFLAPHYSQENVKIYSTTSERTMMSAQAFAAGLLPPTKEELWNEALHWHPIPIYLTGPYMLQPGPLDNRHAIYKRNVQKALTEYFEKNIRKEVLDFMSKNLGEELTCFDDIVYVYDNSRIGEALGMTLAEWAHKVYPDPLQDYFLGYFNSCVLTDEMKKIYVGPLIHEMITHMENAKKDRTRGPKLLAFCAHDINIVTLLYTMDIPFVTLPGCAASLFFELRRRHEGYFVNVYYKATAEGDEAIPLSLRGRNFDCEFDDFKDTAKKFAFSEENVMRESILLENS